MSPSFQVFLNSCECEQLNVANLAQCLISKYAKVQFFWGFQSIEMDYRVKLG